MAYYTRIAIHTRIVTADIDQFLNIESYNNLSNQLCSRVYYPRELYNMISIRSLNLNSGTNYGRITNIKNLYYFSNVFFTPINWGYVFSANSVVDSMFLLKNLLNMKKICRITYGFFDSKTQKEADDILACKCIVPYDKIKKETYGIMYYYDIYRQII